MYQPLCIRCDGTGLTPRSLEICGACDGSGLHDSQKYVAYFNAIEAKYSGRRQPIVPCFDMKWTLTFDDEPTVES